MTKRWSSQGCIVLPENVRKAIGNSGDNVLRKFHETQQLYVDFVGPNCKWQLGRARLQSWGPWGVARWSVSSAAGLQPKALTERQILLGVGRAIGVSALIRTRDQSGAGPERVRIREVPAVPLLWLELAPQQWPAGNVDAINMVTLWHLLLAVCFAMPIGGALASAKLAKVGFGGYALATTLGLGLGVCCAWMMKAVGATVAARIERKSESLRERYFRALYFAAMLWIMSTVFFGKWLSSVVLRLVY